MPVQPNMEVVGCVIPDTAKSMPGAGKFPFRKTPIRRAPRYGNGWECKRGYLEKSADCVRIVVPPNAFLTGTDWKCDRGYRRLGDSCAPINLPENGYLTGFVLQYGLGVRSGL